MATVDRDLLVRIGAIDTVDWIRSLSSEQLRLLLGRPIQAAVVTYLQASAPSSEWFGFPEYMQGVLRILSDVLSRPDAVVAFAGEYHTLPEWKRFFEL